MIIDKFKSFRFSFFLFCVCVEFKTNVNYYFENPGLVSYDLFLLTIVIGNTCNCINWPVINVICWRSIPNLIGSVEYVVVHMNMLDLLSSLSYLFPHGCVQGKSQEMTLGFFFWHIITVMMPWCYWLFSWHLELAMGILVSIRDVYNFVLTAHWFCDVYVLSVQSKV